MEEKLFMEEPAPFIPDWDAIKFEEVESMGCADRGGYGSTGVM